MPAKAKPCRKCQRLRLRIALAILTASMLIGAAYFAIPARAVDRSSPDLQPREF